MPATNPIADDPRPSLDERAMTPRELCAALQISMATFYNFQALGRFERFELRPRIGPRRYSRKLVREYLDGGPSSRVWGKR